MRWRRAKSRELDLDRELRAHLELEAEERQDLTREEAVYAARRALGNTTLVKEEVREMWGWNFASRLGQDLRYALRTVRSNRAPA